MATTFAHCCVYVPTEPPQNSGLLHWHWGNNTLPQCQWNNPEKYGWIYNTNHANPQVLIAQPRRNTAKQSSVRILSNALQLTLYWPPLDGVRRPVARGELVPIRKTYTSWMGLFSSRSWHATRLPTRSISARRFTYLKSSYLNTCVALPTRNIGWHGIQKMPISLTSR